MKNFFTADLHLDHESSINFPRRKHFSLEEWQNLIIDNINKKVSRSDKLWILGDFCLKTKSASFFRSKIKAQCVLIHGNHDPSISSCRSVFSEVYSTRETKCKNVSTFLSHYQHLHWPKSHYGSFHLFGHTHMAREDFWDSVPELKERRSLDVCPEHAKKLIGDYEPFSEDEIYEILIKKIGHDPVKWYQQEQDK